MRHLAALVALAFVACGYRPLHAMQSGESRLGVALVVAHVADPTVADEVASGAREELAKEGALAGAARYPRVEIEVSRADETSEGIAAPTGSAAPSARATEVGVVARAWIVAEPGGERIRDTGDVRAEDLVGADADPRVDVLRHADALRAVARRVGARLARKVLGEPALESE